MTYYWSAIVSTAYLVSFSSYLTLSDIVTLKSRLVTQGHLKWHHLIDRI